MLSGLLALYEYVTLLTVYPLTETCPAPACVPAGRPFKAARNAYDVPPRMTTAATTTASRRLIPNIGWSSFRGVKELALICQPGPGNRLAVSGFNPAQAA